MVTWNKINDNFLLHIINTVHKIKGIESIKNLPRGLTFFKLANINVTGKVGICNSGIPYNTLRS